MSKEKSDWFGMRASSGILQYPTKISKWTQLLVDLMFDSRYYLDFILIRPFHNVKFIYFYSFIDFIDHIDSGYVCDWIYSCRIIPI